MIAMAGSHKPEIMRVMIPFRLIHLLLAAAALAGAARQPLPIVVFETDKGSIEMEVDSVRAR